MRGRYGIRLACLGAQVRVDGSQYAHLYETVPVVDGSPILRDLLFSPDHRHIYLLSEKQVGPRRAAAGGGVGAGRVLTRLSPGEPAPGGDVRAVRELRGLPWLGGPPLWLVCAAAQVRTAVGGPAPRRGQPGLLLIAHTPVSPAHALVASSSVPFYFIQLTSRTSIPRDAPWAAGDEAKAHCCLALWAGPAGPSSLQASTAPLARALRGSCVTGCGLIPRRCCRQGACPGASAPHGFAEELSKCVQVRVRPNNVSVTSAGVQVSGVVGAAVRACACARARGEAGAAAGGGPLLL